MIIGIDPKVDYAFKRLFGREQNTSLLISLLNAVLAPPPGAEVAAVELLNPFQDKEFETDKLSILDIKARDCAGRRFNVEMQLLVFGAFRPRVLYYWAKLHQGHLTEGQDYAELRPTLSIVFVNEPLFPELPHWHSIFELRERQTGTVFSDQLQLRVVEIPKFSLSAQELRTPLEAWIYFLKHGAELDTDQLPAALHGPSYEQALKEMTQMTQSELERERYESRLKAQRDFAAAVQEARSEGLAEGMQKATAAMIREVHLCQRLLGQALTPIETLRALPVAELERLIHDLEIQVGRSAPG